MSDTPELVSEQRPKYETLCLYILAGKASQQEAVDAIRKLCADNERLATISAKTRAERDAAVAQAREEAGPPFHFDRYVNGVLMAEGVTIEREASLSDAMRVAAKIAAKGPNGEVPVLVLTTQASRNRAGKVQP